MERNGKSYLGRAATKYGKLALEEHSPFIWGKRATNLSLCSLTTYPKVKSTNLLALLREQRA